MILVLLALYLLSRMHEFCVQSNDTRLYATDWMLFKMRRMYTVAGYQFNASNFSMCYNSWLSEYITRLHMIKIHIPLYTKSLYSYTVLCDRFCYQLNFANTNIFKKS